MFLFFTAFCCLAGFAFSIDLTRVPNANGPEVVEAVVNIIRESCLFADDKRFLRRLAYIESQDGMAPMTYRPGYNGGIWQVDEAAFKATQGNSSLSAQYYIIRHKIGINWSLVSWSDLRKPLYSGVAAALYTLLAEEGSTAITWKVEEQGNFWSAHFHSGRSATNFTQLANLLDMGCHVNQEVDLVFVVDSSSSLSRDDFDRALYFVDQVVRGFTISPTETRVGMITFSSTVRVEFSLDDYSYYSALSSAILNVHYHSGSTQTAAAIDKAVNYVFSPAHGARPGVVKVMVVVTDGDSDDPINTRHAAKRAQAVPLVVFSVGVGHAIHTRELYTIASQPDCTHAYQVRDYEEIRFLTEEIQHATCIAPLFINNTFSCEISHCPPLAVVTPPGGVTVETNISCGGMNVYSAFSNPYPNKAQYEHLVSSTPGNPTQNFYNSTISKTLYLNLKDNQGHYPYFNASTGCIATITPYHGDHTDKEVIVRCIQNNVEIPCLPSYFNCTETWNFPNPCTHANVLAGKTRFPHPYHANKFIMCDQTGKEYVVICPPGEVYQADCSACIGTGSISTANCNTPLTTTVSNPCSAASILAGRFYFPYPNDNTKYIQCDIWGHPWERNCLPGQEWEQSELTCIVTPSFSPCRHHDRNPPYLYPHQCDPHKFIHCDLNGQSFIQECQLDFLFLPASETCVPRGFPGSESLVNTCNGAYQTYSPHIQGYTTKTYYTSGVAGYTFSATGLWQSPCTHLNVASGYLYFPYQYNRHQYIQCDLNGRQYLRSCSDSGRDFYDPTSHTCVDGPVTADNIVGRR